MEDHHRQQQQTCRGLRGDFR